MSYQEKRISFGNNVIVLFDWFSPYKAKEGWEGWETMGNNAFLRFRFSTTAKARTSPKYGHMFTTLVDPNAVNGSGQMFHEHKFARWIEGVYLSRHVPTGPILLT